MVQEAFGKHDIENGIADGHGQRIAPVSRPVGAGLHAACRVFGRKAGAQREAAANALRNSHDVGRDAGPFVGKQLAGAPDAGLDLVEDQQQAVLVAQLPERPHEFPGCQPQTALALHRLDEDRSRCIGDCRLQGVEVAERHLVEAADLRPEAFQVLCLTAGRDRGQRAPVEGTLEGNDMETLGMALYILVATGRLDGAFQCFRTGIGKEDLVGEGRLGKSACKTLLPGDIVKVREVPELLRLVL